MPHSSFIRSIGSAVFVLIAAFVLASCSLADEPAPAGPVEVGPLPGQESKLLPASLPDLADGAQIFADHCAACHGLSGKGDGPQSAGITQAGGHVPDLTDPAFAHASSPRVWFETITNGNMAKLMPPWSQSLTDQQRWDVTYYVTTLGTSPDTLNQGKAAYASTCQTCHAADGSQNGLTDAAKMSALSAQDIYNQYITSGSDGVHTFGDKIDEPTRWSLVGYVRSFSYNAASQVAAAATPTPTSQPTTQPTVIPTLEGTPGTPAQTTEATAEPTIEPTAAADGTLGSVSGKVSNDTAGAAVPADLSVTLSGLALDANGNVGEFLNKKASITADDLYRFDDLPLDKGKSAYVVTVTYNGLQFENFQQVDPASPSIDLPLTIYESTSDPSAVSLDAVHYFFTQHQTSLLVVQVMIFSNGTDKAYVSASALPTGQKPSVAFGLPADATSVSFDTGDLGTRFARSGDLVYDTQPLLPGQGSDTISATYIVPYNNGRDFSFPIQYPTGLVNVLAPPEMQLNGDSFVKGADKSFQSRDAQRVHQTKPSGRADGWLPHRGRSSILRHLAGRSGSAACAADHQCHRILAGASQCDSGRACRSARRRGQRGAAATDSGAG